MESAKKGRKPLDKDQYGEDETARRRDVVIRRMANTPPQPRVKPSTRPPRKKKTIAQSREAGKDRA